MIISSDNGLSPGRRQVIIWANAGILLIGPLGTNFNEILIKIQIFSLKKNTFENVVCEMLSISYRPQYVNTDRITYKCVSAQGQHWCRQWLVVWSPPNHYQINAESRFIIVNSTPGNSSSLKFEPKFRHFSLNHPVHQKQSASDRSRYAWKNQFGIRFSMAPIRIPNDVDVSHITTDQYQMHKLLKLTIIFQILQRYINVKFVLKCMHCFHCKSCSNVTYQETGSLLTLCCVWCSLI